MGTLFFTPVGRLVAQLAGWLQDYTSVMVKGWDTGQH